MLLFNIITSSSNQSQAPDLGAFAPIIQNGYVYILGLYQSNGVSDYPKENPDPQNQPGNRIDPIDQGLTVEVPDMAGGWKPFRFDEERFHNNSMYAQFCAEIARAHNLKVRFYPIGESAQALSSWLPGGQMHNKGLSVFNSFGADQTARAANANFEIPNIIWQMQGEGNGSGIGYSDEHDAVLAEFVSNGWLQDTNPYMVVHQIFYERTINTVLENEVVADNPQKRILVPSYGIEKVDDPHVTGKWAELMGQRAVRYLEFLFGVTTDADDGIRPARPSFSKIQQRNDDITISWNAVSGADSYNVYHKTGYILYQNVPSTTNQITIPFTVAAGEAESFYIGAQRANGNTSWFYSLDKITEVRGQNTSSFNVDSVVEQ